MVFAQHQAPQSIVWIWKSKCTPRLKFFMWLLQADRLNTRNLLKRKGHPQLQQSDHCICVLCNREEETQDHLFFDCIFSKRCWRLLHIHWQQNPIVHERIKIAKNSYHQPFFMEIFTIAAWEIWRIRNEKIFDNRQPTLQHWVMNFREQIILHLHRVPIGLRQLIQSWFDLLFV